VLRPGGHSSVSYRGFVTWVIFDQHKELVCASHQYLSLDFSTQNKITGLSQEDAEKCIIAFASTLQIYVFVSCSLHENFNRMKKNSDKIYFKYSEQNLN